MHIDVTGHGPDLVLIHGWALQGGVFAPLVQRLADRFTLHLVDLPGHGHSRDDSTPLRLPHVVNAIAAATPSAVWCGWSLGGLFALHAAATLPKVRGLAMIAATPRFV
ncbi:alpha/beta fold hydrolase, partial [Stenotrophomonas sp.]